jgi:hypothetical protein
MNKIIAQENPEFVQHYQLTLDAVCGILSLSRGSANCGANVAPESGEAALTITERKKLKKFQSPS